MGMKFVVIPVEDLKQVDEHWEERRKSVDGTQAIIHYELLMDAREELGLQTLNEDGNPIELPYPTLEGVELENLLSNSEWTLIEEQ